MSPSSYVLPLVERAVRGDRTSLELLLVLHRPRVLAYLEKHTPQAIGRTIEPADIFQDVCFEAFRRIGGFVTDGTDDCLFRWLATIARNRIVHLVRMHRAAKRGGRGGIVGEAEWRSAASGDDDSMTLLLSDLAVYERTPSRSAIARELLIALDQSIARLAPDYRQAIRFRYMDQLPVREAALKMNRTERAFHMLCNRGLKALRREMRSASRYV